MAAVPLERPFFQQPLDRLAAAIEQQSVHVVQGFVVEWVVRLARPYFGIIDNEAAVEYVFCSGRSGNSSRERIHATTRRAPTAKGFQP